MMQEDQNTEWKQSWQDDCLKEICAFANAQGGSLYIGIDDKGEIVGISNTKKLINQIPTKIRDILGIVSEVNVLEQTGKQYLEIIVPKSPTPISVRGKFYLRSGSSKMELSGTALNSFLLNKMNLTWDEIIDNNATIDDIDGESIELYKRIAKSKGRIPNVESLSPAQLLEKLKLISEGKLTRAAILLFGKRPYDFYHTTHIKIGSFGRDSGDIKYHDLIDTNIVKAHDNVLKILDEKYLISPISFEGFYRKETLEYPVEALREALLNALIHRDYAVVTDIYIRVFADKIMISNPGKLPKELRISDLKTIHESYPRNKLLAKAIYRTGLIEQWGSGTIKIYKECKRAGLPEPRIEERQGGITVTLFKDRYNKEFLQKSGLSERQIKAILYVKNKGKITNKEYQSISEVSRETATRDLKKMVELQLLEKSGTKGASVFYELR